MARYYGLGGAEPIHQSERCVAESLKTLSDEWVVLHHIAWQSKRAGRQGDGEADFLIIHRTHGALICEVKGGDVEVLNGRWQTTDHFGQVHTIKNPYEQAVDSKHAFLETLKSLGFDKRLRVGHCVIFPAMTELPPLGMAANAAITILQPALDDILSAIERCVSHWELKATLTKGELERLVERLAPTLKVRRSLASQSAAAEEELIELTADQVAAFSGLRSSRGGLILGSAGTGKTVLAIARAKQLAADGFRTLLLCYNSLLGAELRSALQTEPNIHAGTYHSLCLDLARAANLTLPSNLTNDWWEREAPMALLEAFARGAEGFDAAVVDEAQDFAPTWLDSIRAVTTRTIDAPMYVFADPLQDIWQRSWSRSTDYGFTYELSQNLRNTAPIATRVFRTIGRDGPSRGASGPDPIWHLTTAGRNFEAEALRVVEDLVEQGFGPTNLVVVCQSNRLVQRVRERTVGAFSFGAWRSNGIPVETISRFKGLESEAIVLVLDDGGPADPITVAYVGMSRARSVLTVVGPVSQKTAVRWD